MAGCLSPLVWGGASTSESAPSFSGWARRLGKRARWVLICRAATEEACWEELLKRVPPGEDKLVRRGNANPNGDKR